jgi:hypothetical protein
MEKVLAYVDRGRDSPRPGATTTALSGTLSAFGLSVF